MKIQLKRSNVLDNNVAKEPTPAQMEFGELAVNYNTADPAIFLKDEAGNIIRVAGIGNISDDGQVELPSTINPPANPLPGNLWFNADDGRLYIYYDDGNTAQWVDASPDSWNASVVPDINGSDNQAGTLDDRYLKLGAGAGAQVVQSTDPTEFVRGLNITGGANDVSNGISNYSSSKGVKLISDNKDVITARTTGNSGIQLLQEVDSSRTSGSFQSFVANTEIGNMGTQNVTSFRSRVELDSASIGELKLFDTFTTGTPAGVTEITGYSASSSLAKGDINYGFKSDLSSGTADNYNFYAAGSAPSFLAGSTYIGGTTIRNTFDLWKSTLTEEQLEELTAGTLVAPANVSLPGDGSFARQWYYNQQSAEDQAALTAGTLEYPTHLAAATFTDTFALGDNTKISLNSDGKAQFRGTVELKNTVPQFRMSNTQGAVDNQTFLFRNTNSGAKLQILAINDAGSAGGNSVSFERTGNSVDSLSCNSGGNVWFSCDNVNKKVTVNGLVESAGGVKVTGGTINLTAADGEIAYGTDPDGLANTLQIKGSDTGQWLSFYGGGIRSIGNNSRAGFVVGGLFGGVTYSANNTTCQCFTDNCNYADVGDVSKVSFYANPKNLTFPVGATNKYRAFYSTVNSDTTSGNNIAYAFYAGGNAPNYFAGRTVVSAANGVLVKRDTVANDDWTLREHNGIFITDAIVATRTSSAPLELNRGTIGDTSLNDANFHQIASYRYKGSQVAQITINNTGAKLSGFTTTFSLNEDARILSAPTDFTDASTTLKLLEPKVEGFVADKLQQHMPAAVDGTKDATEAIGTLTDYDGTELEVSVTEPDDLTYTEEVETEGVATMVTRTRTWTATGTQPVYQGVDQTKLIPILTKALQESLDKIDALEARLNAAGIA